MGLDEIVKLGLEKGFFFPSAEIYSNAPAGFWEYGHLGAILKQKYMAWYRLMVRYDDMVLIDGSQILPRDVFVASGHLNTSQTRSAGVYPATLSTGLTGCWKSCCL
jgi:glycyl-tRNA synthetase